MSACGSPPTHINFGHTNIIKYCNRPFATVHDMNVALTENWNKHVKPEDTVYHLGDFAWGDPWPYRKKLNGRIFLIRGNHDKQVGNSFEEVRDFLILRDLLKVPVVLFHYAMRTWPHSHYNSFMLYGHSHGTLPSYGKSFDVGVDCWNYRPISLEEVVTKINTLADNPDLVASVTPKPAEDKLLSRTRAYVLETTALATVVHLSDLDVTATIPNVLFASPELCRIGQSLYYEVSERPDGTRYHKVVEHRDNSPEICQMRKDVTKILDSIPDEP